MIPLVNHDSRVRSQWGRYILRIYIVYPIPWYLLYTWGWLYNMFYPLVNYHNYGKSAFIIGKSTISMAIFKSFLYVYQRVYIPWTPIPKFTNCSHHLQLHSPGCCSTGFLSSAPFGISWSTCHWLSPWVATPKEIIDLLG